MRVISVSSVWLLMMSPTTAETLQAGRQVVEQGAASGAPACTSGHGQHLEGNAAIKSPALAGEPSAYVISRLHHYASPEGHNVMMKQVATELTPAEQDAVANYIATLPRQH